MDDDELKPAVELVDITKAFPGVVANDAISFSLRRGEVHILLGENGAGKSTLISILSGMLTPDAGQIIIDGEPAEIRSPRDALDAGIGTVYQHSLLVPTLTVLDNMMLGTNRSFRLDRVHAQKRMHELTQLLDVEIDPDARVGDLALGQRQQAEIIRALWSSERVLVLDEPTSMLTPQGVQSLGRVMRRLAERGLSVVFITHKLNEAIDFGDRITVLRRGRKVGELEPLQMVGKGVDDLKDEIIALMFGASSAGADANPSGNIEKAEWLDQQPVCFRLVDVEIQGDGPKPILDGITLELRRGEVLGIAGIDGNGQKELAEVIAGQRPLLHGQVYLDDKEIQRLSVAKRQDLGIRYVTDDRHGEGTVGQLSIAINSVIKRIGQRPFWRRTRIRHAVINEFARTMIAEQDVRTPNEKVPIATLSGGNMQKIVVGRELAKGPRVVVYNKPTYGLDVKTMQVVLNQIVEQARRGTTAILISTELDELISASDRIAVMYEGRITGILPSRPGIEAQLGELMTGASA